MAGRSKVFFGLEGEAVYMPNARIATAKIINMARSSERFASNSRFAARAMQRHARRGLVDMIGMFFLVDMIAILLFVDTIGILVCPTFDFLVCFVDVINMCCGTCSPRYCI